MRGARPAWVGHRLLMRTRFRDESGQTMAEYAVTLGVITAALVLTFGTLGDAIAEKIAAIAGLIG